MGGCACSGQHRERTVLLMGETGSGKSTFINYLTNYFGNGTLNSLKVMIPNRFYIEPTEKDHAGHNEADPTNPTVSQTQECSSYSFRGDRERYRFIDTPGFSDTSNSVNHSTDNDVSTKILSAVTQARSLQAIAVIINGSHSRLTDSIRNALKQIAGNYPTTLSKNMLVVFTNCTAATKNFDESSLPFEPRQVFVMNNSAFSFERSQFDVMDESEKKMQTLNWQYAMKQIREFVACIDKLNGKSTKVFRKMRENRINLTYQVQLAIKEIKRQAVLSEEREKLQKQKLEIENTLRSKEEQVRSLDQAIQSSESQKYSQAADRRQVENEKNSAFKTWVAPRYGVGLGGSNSQVDTKLHSILVQKYDAHITEENRLQRMKDDSLKQKREIEMSLSSIKQQREAIRFSLTENENQMSDSEGQQAIIQVQIKKLCKNLSKICKKFDLKDELHATISSLHTEISFLKTTKSRQDADTIVQMMRQLSEVLE